MATPTVLSCRGVSKDGGRLRRERPPRPRKSSSSGIRQQRKECSFLSESSIPDWRVPIRQGAATDGYALSFAEEDPEDAPKLEGVFGSIDEAKAALSSKGALG
jgi:hypothetical protein